MGVASGTLAEWLAGLARQNAVEWRRKHHQAKLHGREQVRAAHAEARRSVRHAMAESRRLFAELTVLDYFAKQREIARELAR